ncbi:MAG: hypothetical protein ACI837_001135 [Crocinitomicaceae bacterium]|jgi:hypothetical protein
MIDVKNILRKKFTLRIIILGVITSISITNTVLCQIEKRNLPSHWALLDFSEDNSNILLRDTLKFEVCNNCYPSDSLASKPKFVLYRRFGRNNEGVRYHGTKKAFLFCFVDDIQDDSSNTSISYKPFINGRWQCKRKNKEMNLILHYYSHDDTLDSTSKMIKREYRILVLSKGKMILVRRN